MTESNTEMQKIAKYTYVCMYILYNTVHAYILYNSGKFLRGKIFMDFGLKINLSSRSAQ